MANNSWTSRIKAAQEQMNADLRSPAINDAMNRAMRASTTHHNTTDTGLLFDAQQAVDDATNETLIWRMPDPTLNNQQNA